MFSRYAVSVILGLMSSCPALAVSGALEDSHRLRFAVGLEHPPAAFQEDGHLRGVAVDLISAILKQADIHASIEGLDGRTAKDLLASGQADALILINEPRLNDIPASYSDMVLGYQASPSNISLATLPVQTEEVRSVMTASTDFPLQVLVAFNANNPELRTRFNQALAEVKTNGSFESILQSWGGERIVYASDSDHALTLSRFYIAAALALTMAFALLWWRSHRLRQRVDRMNERLNSSNADLRTANEAKTRFLNTVSHELRTPLNGMNGLVYSLMRTVQDDRSKDYLQRLNNAVNHLNSLITEVLDINKIEYGKMELDLEPVSLTTLTEYVTSMITDSASLKNITLSLSNSRQLPAWVEADPKRLRQILLNYLSNAVKFTREGGRVNLSSQIIGWHNDSVTIRFKVSDTGIGISVEDQGLLFEVFEQGRGKTSKRYGGSGLGLALVKSLTELMKGEVGYRSILNLGSEFWVDIPFKVTTPGEDALEAGEDLDKSQPLKGLKILVVDDQDLNVMVTENILQSCGAMTLSATDGRSAIEKLRHTDRVDVILMDIYMPIMDGIEATRKIRTNKRFHATRIIGLTGAAINDDRKDAEEAGMDDILTKPLDPQKLVKLCLSNRGSRTAKAVQADA